MKVPPETVRIDRWLMAARFFKTRSQAAGACEGRKVKVNDIAAKPHKALRVGDRVTIHHRGRYRNLDVLGLAERGLPPAAARELYHEEETMHLSETEQELIRQMRQAGKKHSPKYKGRPTKKERREIDRFRERMPG
ncbi:MAG TPA: RNA-binding S4 domain-containing protein [bacterium]|nr:RNA-binding S4 domain-containing protein [bacterium]